MITSRMLKILPLPGFSITRSRFKAVVLIPFLPIIKWFRTILVFLRYKPMIIIKHPLSVIILALGLLPWTVGFWLGIFSDEL